MTDTPAEQPSGSGNVADYSGYKVEELMKLYYTKLFPHKAMTKWLSYGNDSKMPQADAGFFRRREFCFTLDGDIFVRFQSFKDGAELQKAIIDRCPSKIDIGPVYNIDPQRRAAYSGSEKGFVPVERELVFDIDMTDYDDVRTCGKDGHICVKCWPFMAAAIKVVDAGLREDFGFEHVLWVFSGRRGVHCWVADERARRLTDEQRSGIANYFCVYKGQEAGLAKVAVTQTLHPALQRAKEALYGVWGQYVLPQQRLLHERANWEKVLAYVPAAVKQQFEARWAKRGDEGVTDDEALERWEELHAALVAAKLEKEADRIVFAHTYPRLDMEVSKKMNHLLKAPFCVHPKTGKVCVPIDPDKADAFDPDQVATVAALLAQLDTNKESAQPGMQGWEITSLAADMDLFQRSFLDGLAAEAKQKLADRAREGAAQPTLVW